MWDRKKLIARARHRVRTTAQSVAAIEAALQEMIAMILSLDRRVASEEARTRTRDKQHVAYSTVSFAARVRSDNLKKSVTELEAQRAVTTEDHQSALAALGALEKVPEGPALIRLPRARTKRAPNPMGTAGFVTTNGGP